MQNLLSSDCLLSNERVADVFARVDHACAQHAGKASIYRELLQILIDNRLVCDAAIWRFEQGQVVMLAKSPNWQAALPDPLHQSILQSESGTCFTLPLPRETTATLAGNVDRSLTAFHVCAESFLIVDATTDAGSSPQVMHQRQEIIQGFAEVAGNQFARQRYQSLLQRDYDLRSSRSLVDVLTQSQSLVESTRDLADVLIDETGADRISLLQYRHGKASLLAVSPAGSIDHQMPLVRAMAGIVSLVASTTGKLSYCMGVPTGKPLDEALITLIDQSESRQLEIQVDSDSNDPYRAAIMLERFKVDHGRAAPDQQSIQQALPVLKHLMDLHSRGFGGTLQRIKSTSPIRSAARLLIGLIVLLLMLAVIPGDLWITVDGHLHPVASRGLFAPGDGVIEDLYVKHGDSVDQQFVLLRIRDPKLELRISEIQGQIATLQSQLASARAARSQDARESGRNLSGQLSAHEQDLQIQIAGLERQRTVVTKHLQQLELTSPIAGTVHRWDMQQALRDRPVTHGQHLLDVIDSRSQWELRLDVPDDLVGYVIDAQRNGPCDVIYRIRSDPAESKSATIDHVSGSSQIDSSGRTTVLTVANLDGSALVNPRIGAGVVAKVRCGRRSLAFVWLREVVEFGQRNFYW